MDPVSLVFVPGLIGGIAIAVLFSWSQRRRTPPSLAAPVRQEMLSTDVINMASIKVAGIGGLGLVAMAAFVAIDVPRIGQTVLLGFVLGVIVAAVLILRRRRAGGPMPSSGRGLGANTTLCIDQRAQTDDSSFHRPADRTGAVLAPGH